MFISRRPARAFTIVEVLVVLGIVMIVAALAIPALSGSKFAAKQATTLSRIQQMTVGLQMYADANADLPPLYGKPDRPETPWQFDWGPLESGKWFDHSYLYSIAITGFLGDSTVAVAVGNPIPRPVLVHQGVPTRMSDFFLTNTLFADPSFFNWETRGGREQMRAQRLSSILFPSDKGLLRQAWVYGVPERGNVLACCDLDIESAVSFADLSASMHVQKRMRPGIHNPYTSMILPDMDPRDVPGAPVADTIDGVRGRDRGGPA